MTNVKLKEEILKMRFEEIYEDFREKKLSCHEAALILGMSERQLSFGDL